MTVPARTTSRARRARTSGCGRRRRKAFGRWAARTAHNRGQILYRAAEALEPDADRFDRAEVEEAVDLLIHYAGWTDKPAPVLGGVNPVAAPFLSFSLPEPTGVVGVVAPEEPPLLGLVQQIAPALAAGNAVVAILSEATPLPGLDLAEALGVSDVPSGVVNLLSGRRDELSTALAGHRDVNAIVDAAGVGAELDRLGAETIKRVRHWNGDEQPLERLEALTELKTAWHPIGA